MRLIQQRSLGGWLWQAVVLGLVILGLWELGRLESWAWFPVGWALSAVVTTEATAVMVLVCLGVWGGRVIPPGWQGYLLGVVGLLFLESWSHDGRVDGRWSREPERVRYIWLGPRRWPGGVR